MNKDCGIYKIENKINGKIYIGSSNDIKSRWAGHKTSLKNKYHANKHLQASWLKYGENNFIFEIIEKCSNDKLIEKEQYWLEFYKNKNLVYNKGLCVECPARGTHLSKETKKLLSDKNKGKKLSEETKNKMKKKIPWNKGKHLTEEHRKKLSEARKGKFHLSRDNIEMLRSINKGKHRTQETKDKISKSNMGKKGWNKGMVAWNKGIEFRTPEHIEKLKLVNTGRKCSEETKNKIGKANAIKMRKLWEKKKLTDIEAVELEITLDTHIIK